MTTAALPYARLGRLTINRSGLWLFFASESFLFLALLSSRYALLGVDRPAELNQPLGLIITAVLLLSSLTAYRAEASIAHGDRPRLLRNTLATIALGLLFLIGVGVEWGQAFRHFPPQGLFGTVFFSLTGLHAFHVLSGLLLLALLYLNSRRGGYSAESYWGVEGAVKYWHFIDVAWDLSDAVSGGLVSVASRGLSSRPQTTAVIGKRSGPHPPTPSPGVKSARRERGSNLFAAAALAPLPFAQFANGRGAGGEGRLNAYHRCFSRAIPSSGDERPRSRE